MQIVNLADADSELVHALARLTFVAMRAHAPNWLKTVDDGLNVLFEAQGPGKAGRVLMDGSDPRGWVAAGPLYGRVWDLHPLAIDPACQRRGYGRMLVEEIERTAADAGALTMCLSTSDTTEATTLGGTDLYEDPIGALARLEVVDEQVGHAVQFWRNVGYTLVGVLPDAEGLGMPSINFAKRLSRSV